MGKPLCGAQPGPGHPRPLSTPCALSMVLRASALPRPRGLGCQRLTSSRFLGTLPILEGCGCRGESWCPAPGAACPPGSGGALGQASQACRPGHLDQHHLPSTVAGELVPGVDGWSREASSLRLCPRPRSSGCLWGQGSGLTEQGHPSPRAVNAEAPSLCGRPTWGWLRARHCPDHRQELGLPESLRGRPGPCRGRGRAGAQPSLQVWRFGDLPTCRARRPPSPELSRRKWLRRGLEPLPVCDRVSRRKWLWRGQSFFLSVTESLVA